MSEYELMLESSSSPVDAVNSGIASAMHCHTVYQGPRIGWFIARFVFERTIEQELDHGRRDWSAKLRQHRLPAIGQRLTRDPPLSNNGAPVVEFRLHQVCRMVSRETPVSDRDTRQNIASEKTEILQRTQRADSPSSSPSIGTAT